MRCKTPDNRKYLYLAIFLVILDIIGDILFHSKCRYLNNMDRKVDKVPDWDRMPGTKYYT